SANASETSPAAPNVKTASPQTETGGSSGPKSKEQKRIEAEARNRLSAERKQLKHLVNNPESADWKSVPASLLNEAQRLLEARIAKLEQEKSGLEKQLADPDFYADTNRSSKVIKMFDDANVKIGLTMSRWETVASRLEKHA
ncbi:ABC transporter C-terminal domain-containing protein, partial [Bacteroidota bacterium]